MKSSFMSIMVGLGMLCAVISYSKNDITSMLFVFGLVITGLLFYVLEELQLKN